MSKTNLLSGAPFKWRPGHLPYLPYPRYATAQVESNLKKKKEKEKKKKEEEANKSLTHFTYFYETTYNG